MSSLRRTAAASVLVLTATFSLAGCSGDDADTQGAGGNTAADTDGDDSVSPEEVLAFAKTELDETPGVTLTLSTDATPDSDAFLAKATGTVTADPPAFEGKASGTFGGTPASDVDIVSVDDKVYANIFGFAELDLPDCVPDPAGLLDPETGFSTVLSGAEAVTAGEPRRGGADNDEILTPYTATVPGQAVQNLLPCAPGAEFDATFTIDDQGLLRTADLTGDFFEEGSPLTYTITIDAYDVDEAITKP